MTSGITKYPDEPHPDDEHAWKSWWVRKCFDLNEPVTRGEIKWIDQCWKTTKANWNNDDNQSRVIAENPSSAVKEKLAWLNERDQIDVLMKQLKP